TRMSCDAFSRSGTPRNQTQRGRPGSRCSAMRRTACGALISFGANRHPPRVLGARGDGPMHPSDRGRWRGRGAMDGVGLCRMFNHATRGHAPPTYLSSDHDRLFEFHRWQANLRILDIEAIKTVPFVPLSHPFVERLIGTIRRECLDRTLFWTAADLER